MCSTQTNVCVLTARGMAAISSIALAGPDARGILKKVFRASGSTAKHSLTVPPHQSVLHGSIVDGDRAIDEVVVGCEETDRFVIHCHGNPLLVEQIIKLIQSHGAVLTDPESFAFSNYQRISESLIEAEAKLAMQKSATVLGVKILQAQIDGGLSQWVNKTRSKIDTLNVEDIKQQCSKILEHSKIARRIIEGVRIVIAGPPNSGKSTLLNCLAGQEQVIVSDTAGTTRDWVSVTAYLGDGALRAEFIDTAGLDDALAEKDDIEQTAQAMTRDLLGSCDLILYVQDVTQQAIDRRQWAEDTPIIYVHNKCDLVEEHKNTRTQEYKYIPISAQNNEGVDQLIQEILKRLNLTVFDVGQPVAFTDRQRDLLLSIISIEKQPEELLSGLLYFKN